MSPPGWCGSTACGLGSECSGTVRLARDKEKFMALDRVVGGGGHSRRAVGGGEEFRHADPAVPEGTHHSGKPGVPRSDGARHRSGRHPRQGPARVDPCPAAHGKNVSCSSTSRGRSRRRVRHSVDAAAGGRTPRGGDGFQPTNWTRRFTVRPSTNRPRATSRWRNWCASGPSGSSNWASTWSSCWIASRGFRAATTRSKSRQGPSDERRTGRKGTHQAEEVFQRRAQRGGRRQPDHPGDGAGGHRQPGRRGDFRGVQRHGQHGAALGPGVDRRSAFSRRSRS